MLRNQLGYNDGSLKRAMVWAIMWRNVRRDEGVKVTMKAEERQRDKEREGRLRTMG